MNPHHPTQPTELRRRRDAAYRLQPLANGQRDPNFPVRDRQCTPGAADTDTWQAPRPHGKYVPPSPLSLLRQAHELATTEAERKIIATAGRALQRLQEVSA